MVVPTFSGGPKDIFRRGDLKFKGILKDTMNPFPLMPLRDLFYNILSKDFNFVFLKSSRNLPELIKRLNLLVSLQTLRSRGVICPPKFSANVPFFSKSPLNVFFLKEVIKNVHENQYSARVS